MSALKSTCVLRTLFGLKSHKTYSRTYFSKLHEKSTILLSSKSVSTPTVHNIPTVLYYSTKQTASLTDEILSQRVQTDEKVDNGDKESDKKEKKKSNWTGENAWKLGLISMGGTFLFAGSTIVYSWGNF